MVFPCVEASASPPCARMAAQTIRDGGVPHIQDTAALRPYSSSLSHFEQELLAAYLLTRYDSSGAADRVASTRAFAYVVHGQKDGSDYRTFCFWPAHRSANHIESSPIVGDRVQPEERDEATAAAPGNT